MIAPAKSIDVGPLLAQDAGIDLHEPVDIESGRLVHALSKYVPALADYAGLPKYLQCAVDNEGAVPVRYSNDPSGITFEHVAQTHSTLCGLC